MKHDLSSGPTSDSPPNDAHGAGAPGTGSTSDEPLRHGAARDLSGLIWITGFSSAGKTTIGRQVERQLRAKGANVAFLDGDDLRAIFGRNWGYDRDSRIELAHIYFRLCSHLASQGITVVIAAIAMYDEIYTWVKENIPNSIQVYLRVPDNERRKRDENTKRIYSEIGNMEDLYDYPSSPDLILDNTEDSKIYDISSKVTNYYLSAVEEHGADRGRKSHWASFYRSTKGELKPSPFAEFTSSLISPQSKLLEVGCGNGRDATFFARTGHSVTALDTSEAAISLCKEQHAQAGIDFINGSINELREYTSDYFDVIYSRFCLHAMTKPEEEEMLRWSYNLLQGGGKIFIECRSINDPLANEGEVLSPTERIHGHYRRFIVLEELMDHVNTAGFVIEEHVESSGLAVYGDEDPVVIRLVASKPR